ncbi:hypothetical protein E2C01_061017 [Portunus trituberculatus]|uniref:Uncharacterized protein n=1 Tax=Portunus trituberculatus TaxID=210409 RepID=A0A5B7H2R2_PORTR|nr:hypothetical protein [Portunus trituberculatus]
MRRGVALKIAGVGSSSERGGVSGRSCRGGASAVPQHQCKAELVSRQAGRGPRACGGHQRHSLLGRRWRPAGEVAAAQGRPPHPHLDHRGGGGGGHKVDSTCLGPAQQVTPLAGPRPANSAALGMLGPSNPLSVPRLVPVTVLVPVWP